MKTPFRCASMPRASQSGAALIVTLVIISMMAILVMAFSSSMRTERQATKAFSDQIRSEMAAKAAIQHASSSILSNMMLAAGDFYVYTTTNFVGSGTNLITKIVSANGYTNIIGTNVLAAAGGLNLNLYQHIADAAILPQISMDWICVTNQLATRSNQMARAVTRYAYWVDDENSKINLNTAQGTTTNTIRSSCGLDGVSLMGFRQATAVIATNIALDAPYETPYAIHGVSGLSPGSTAYAYGPQFFGTIYSADYERQTNGLVRLNLTNGAWWPNTNSLLSVTSLVAAISNSGPVGGDFCVKWGAHGASMRQIAANIIDQMDSDIDPCDEDPTSYTGSNFFGCEPNPRINEAQMVCVLSKEVLSAQPYFTYTLARTSFVEMINIHGIDFTTNFGLSVSNFPGFTVLTNPGPVTATNISSYGIAANYSGIGISNWNNLASTWGAQKPNVVVLTNALPILTFNIETNTDGYVQVNCLTTSTEITNVVRLSNTTGTRFDWARYLFNTAPTNWGDAGAPVSAFLAISNGISADVAYRVTRACQIAPGDPRLPKIPSTTESQISGTNSLSLCSSLGSPTNSSQDNFNPAPTLANYYTDIGGNRFFETNALAGLDAQNGFPFLNSRFPSAGFFGNVFVGVSNFMTLKMYGDGYSNWNTSARVPDYALMDIFTSNDVSGIRVAGKINVNTLRDLFGDSTGSGNDGVLAGLVLSAPDPLNYPNSPLVSGSAAMMATNIMKQGPYSSIMDFFGRCTVLSTNATNPTDSQREVMARNLANIVTTKSYRYTIWGIGQSINTFPGRTNVLSETRVQAVMEVVPNWTTAGALTNLSSRLLYYRVLESQ